MTGSHVQCIAQNSLLLPLVGRGRVSVLLRPRSRWGRLSIVGLVGRYPANHLMLRERIALRGSPLGLPPRSHGEALTGPWGVPVLPCPPLREGQKDGKAPDAPARGDRPPLGTGGWGAVRGHVVPTSGACLHPPVHIAHSDRRPQGGGGTLGSVRAASSHVLLARVPWSAPIEGFRATSRRTRGVHDDGARTWAPRRGPPRGPTAGATIDPRRRHRVLPVGVDGPRADRPAHGPDAATPRDHARRYRYSPGANHSTCMY